MLLDAACLQAGHCQGDWGFHWYPHFGPIFFNVVITWLDDGRVEVIANGLLLRGGVQLAVDVFLFRSFDSSNPATRVTDVGVLRCQELNPGVNATSTWISSLAHISRWSPLLSAAALGFCWQPSRPIATDWNLECYREDF